jgi:hypothetical protein
MPTDPVEIAREVIALGEKATKGPWSHVPALYEDNGFGGMSFHYAGAIEVAERMWPDGGDDNHLCLGLREDADGAFIAHTRTSAPLLARAMLASHERIRELAADRDAIIAKVRHYEDTLTMRQVRVAHPDGSWTFEIDQQKLGALMDQAQRLRGLLGECEDAIDQYERGAPELLARIAAELRKGGT